MSFIQFESAREKEKLRQQLRNAREELLKRAKHNAENRAERQAQKTLTGEATWMLPAIEKKIEKMGKSEKKSKKSSKKSKAEKKSKKDKKSKKNKRKRKRASSESETSDTEEEIPKKKKKNRKMSTDSSSSSSSESESGGREEWVEKKESLVRDDWMTSPMLLKTFSKNDGKPVKEKQHIESYDPAKSVRELNPHWRDGGSGLPTFKKPSEDFDDYGRSNHSDSHHRCSGGWKKDRRERSTSPSPSRGWRKPTESGGWKKPKELAYERDSSPSFSSSSASGGWKKQKEPTQRREHSSSPSLLSVSGGWRKHKESTQRRGSSPSPSSSSTSGGWKKQQEVTHTRDISPSSSSSSASEDEKESEDKSNFSKASFLTDQQMNELGAKIIKAEIMGNDELAAELKKRLESTREVREQTKNIQKKAALKGKKAAPASDEHVLLTTTDSKGSTRPLLHRGDTESDRYGGRRGRQKKQKADTHVSGERVRYFPDDDKYDIKQMFEREKYMTAADSDAQFAEIAGKHKNPKDDLEDIFADKVRKNIVDSEKADKEKQRAIYEYERMSKTLDNCDKCFDSGKMEKQLLVCMGKNVYLSLPWHEGLQPNHCLIVPMQHVSCSTQLDEDTWEEVSDFRKALTRMFAAHKQDVVFFETARYLHKRPHLAIHCVPSGSMEMAPFYFKKAIQESEYEWSTNKQLVSLKEKGLRRAIPKGLPYFWVNFGMESGFAHVIEDQERFPSNFAQEVIGGMLHLDPSKWRRPRKEQNIIPKVKNLADWWKPYDFTDK